MDTRPAAGSGRRRSEQIVVGAESHQALHFGFELGRVFVVGICVEAARMHICVDHLVEERDLQRVLELRHTLGKPNPLCGRFITSGAVKLRAIRHLYRDRGLLAGKIFVLILVRELRYFVHRQPAFNQIPLLVDT